jgi:hypothetical protein
MKRAHFYILTAAIGLLLILAIVVFTNEPDVAPGDTAGNTTQPQPAPTEPAERTAPLSTTTAAGTFIIDPAIPINERCTPVTLACLEAQPEWNPTMATTGIERIDPSELTLFDGTYQLDYQSVPRSTDPFTFVTAKDEHDPAYCAQYDLTGLDLFIRDEGPLEPSCSIYPPEAYQEFVILDENEAVVHAYRLSDKYSLLELRAGVQLMGRVNSVGAGCCNSQYSTSLSLSFINWSDYNQFYNPIVTGVYINPYTGAFNDRTN